MTGDFSRTTFNARKHYTGVLMQQGRVDMDADWNEAVAIEAARSADVITDVFGDTAAPAAPSFGQPSAFQLILADSDLRITPGRLYLGGAACELDPPTSVSFQPVAGQPSQLTVSTWVVDGWPFTPGQHLEILDSHTNTPLFTITQVDPTSKTLTLDRPVPPGAQSLARLTTYCFQPFVQNETSPLGTPGPSPNYVAYLDQWQRVLTPLDDPSIADVALNGIDSAVRSQTVWQVKLMAVLPKTDQPSIQDALADWQAQVAASTTPRGQMRAAVDATSATLIQNQFYRVEIHCGSIPASTEAPSDVQANLGETPNQVTVQDWTPDGTAWDLGQTVLLTAADGAVSNPVLGQVVDVNQSALTLTLDVALAAGWSGTVQRTVTFKWARDNASVAAAITGVGQNTITVDDSNPRTAGAFSTSGWIELSTPARRLAGLPGVLLTISQVDGSTLTLDYLPREVDETWTVQRWDGAYRTLAGLASPRQVTADTAGNAPLEDGIAVAFAGESMYATSDYWQVAARANTQAIDWPSAGGSLMQPPVGIQHQVTPLAVLIYASSAWSVHDTRSTFPSLINFVDRRGSIMTGPLLIDGTATTQVPPDPATAFDIITSRAMYVGHARASESAPANLPVNPPDLALGANGGVLVWTEQGQQGGIYLKPATTEGFPQAPRVILHSSVTTDSGSNWQSPGLEYYSSTQFTTPALVRLDLMSDDAPYSFRIWSPANGSSSNLLVQLWGELQVNGVLTARGGIASEAWQDLQPDNNWSQYAGPGDFATPAYCKDAMGYVHLRGLIVPPSSVNTTLSAFTLPTGYQPKHTQVFASVAPLLDHCLSILINSDGKAYVTGQNVGNLPAVSLNIAPFFAEQ